MSSSPGLCVSPILRRLTSLLVSLLLLSRCCESVLDIKAKLMDERRVVGQGYSVLASNLDQCLALCNKDPGNCDGVNYREIKNKCRLLARCANTTVIPDTRGFLYYSKRPRVVSEGFKYEPTSDSCLKVIRKLVDYADADRMCAHLNGRLVALTTVAVNTMATSLLRLSGAQYAWIGLQDKAVEGDPTHSDGSVTSQNELSFRPAVQHWRKDRTKNCWALQDDGHWAELSCKNRTLYTICEVPAF